VYVLEYDPKFQIFWNKYDADRLPLRYYKEARKESIKEW